MFIVLLVQTVYAAATEDFHDNYLCLLFALKAGLSSVFLLFSNVTNKQRFSTTLFFFRFFIDVDIIISCVLLRIFGNLHTFCFYLMMATVSSSEVASALTIVLTHEEDDKVVSRKVIDILNED